jgi:hypothetical protein
LKWVAKTGSKSSTIANYFEQAAFANVDSDDGNIDIFMRPQADGGYYETAKAVIPFLFFLLSFPPFLCFSLYSFSYKRQIVLDVINYNGAKYGTNTQWYHNAQAYYGSATSAESSQNYRYAYSKLQLAYLSAVATSS